MKYLTLNGHQLMTKNKLQSAVQDYLKGIDRLLLSDQATFLKHRQRILEVIEGFNQQHSRCKPIEASWFQINKNDWLLSGVGFSNFMIYHVKHEF